MILYKFTARITSFESGHFHRKLNNIFYVDHKLIYEISLTPTNASIFRKSDDIKMEMTLFGSAGTKTKDHISVR